MMLFTNEDLNPLDLDSLETLPVTESAGSDLMGFPVMKKDNGDYIISLEHAVTYCDDYGCGLDDVMNEMADLYHIPVNRIAFSVRPSSVELSETYQGIYKTLRENDVTIYLNDMPYTKESQLIDSIVMECIDTNSTEPLDALLEDGWFNNFAKGMVQGAAHSARQVGAGLATGLRQGVGQGLVRGAQSALDNKLFGRLDTPAKDANGNILTKKRYNNATGRVEDVPDIQKNERLHAMMRDRGISSENLHGMADEVVNSLRGQASSQIVGRLQDFLTGTSHNVSPQGMMDGVNRAIRYYSGRFAGGQGEVGNRGIISKILDKLKALKDKIAAKFRS